MSSNARKVARWWASVNGFGVLSRQHMYSRRVRQWRNPLSRNMMSPIDVPPTGESVAI